jgi:hypothetical protein
MTPRAAHALRAVMLTDANVVESVIAVVSVRLRRRTDATLFANSVDDEVVAPCSIELAIVVEITFDRTLLTLYTGTVYTDWTVQI